LIAIHKAFRQFSRRRDICEGRSRSFILRALRAAFCPLVAVLTISAITPSRTAQAAAEVVRFGGQPAGTVVVKTKERRLYYVLGEGKALRYPVGVGRAGQTWKGNAIITGKYIRPGWRPPAVIKRDKPSLPDLIPAPAAARPIRWAPQR
jgi:lipoprotein-anchoring transpeptidase ErfK/SrfK